MEPFLIMYLICVLLEDYIRTSYVSKLDDERRGELQPQLPHNPLKALLVAKVVISSRLR